MGRTTPGTPTSAFAYFQHLELYQAAKNKEAKLIEQRNAEVAKLVNVPLEVKVKRMQAME